MTNVEVVKALKRHLAEFSHDHGWDLTTITAIQATIEMLEKQGQIKNDFISRQTAIDNIKNIYAPLPSQRDIVEDCLEIINNLPSAELVEWYNLSGNQKGISKMDRVRCPICGYITSPSFMEWEEDGVKYGKVLLPKRCNGCGTMMVGDDE